MIFSPQREFDELMAEMVENDPKFAESETTIALLELQAERTWEKWLSKPEWALIGCLARAGEGLGMIPPRMNDCSGCMLWALGLVDQTTDYRFSGLKVGEDLQIELLTAWPTSMTEDWGHFYDPKTKEYGYRGWSNDVWIFGTMYGTNWQELKPPPGVAGHFPDPDWASLQRSAEKLLREETTRCELPMEMLGELQKMIKSLRSEAKKLRNSPVMQELMGQAFQEAEKVRASLVN